MVWARVRLPGGETVCVSNLHASAGLPDKASAEVLAAAGNAVDWSGAEPLVFGGDLNLRPARTPAPFAELRERYGLGDPTGPAGDRPPARRAGSTSWSRRAGCRRRSAS